MATRKKIAIFLKRRIKLILIAVVPLVFLVIGVATISDYGINWDEPFHFMRGQAYLYFFMTGKKDYALLAPYPKLNIDNNLLGNQKGQIYEDFVKNYYHKDFLGEWRSYYQDDSYTFNDIIKLENGHPPINDIAAAFTNYVFFQRLHIFGDIESYHLFEVLAAFLIVFGIALITYFHFGIFASFVASFSLAAYPLFFSEAHFNIKDPPEAAFYGLTIIIFYFGVIKSNWKLIILSAFAAALAVGTKFNAFFLIPTIGLWILFYLLITVRKRKSVFDIRSLEKIKKIVFSLILYPLIVVAIFYMLWPYLWLDPVNNFLNIVKYYEQIGLGTPADVSRFIFRGWDLYPIVWTLVTTPLPILVLFIFGFLSSIYLTVVKKNEFVFLVVLWFLIPIIRVSLPNASVYGGIRQIMEFLPPMAILSGIGAYSLITLFRKLFPRLKFLYAGIVLLILISLFYVVFENLKIHPNENVYFNQLAGGLSGARAKRIPYWGNSYGNAYLQGVKWLNANAEAGAKIGLPIAYPNNLPPLKLRTDFNLSNGNWSGPNREGEYEIELDFDWSPTAWYSFSYYDTYLDPVFIAQADGVPILKVWKNDLEHTKKGFESEKVLAIVSVKSEKGSLLIDLGKEVSLTRITIFHSSINCNQQKGGYIAISTDGKNWIREPEPIDYPQVPPAAMGINDNNFVFLFAAKKARYILLDTTMQQSCLLKNPSIEIRGLAS